MALKSINQNSTTNEIIEVPDWNGRIGAILASGNFDGATVSLQHKIGNNWVALGEETTLTVAGGGQFITPQSQLRVVISGGSQSSQSIDVVVKPIVI